MGRNDLFINVKDKGLNDRNSIHGCGIKFYSVFLLTKGETRLTRSYCCLGQSVLNSELLNKYSRTVVGAFYHSKPLPWSTSYRVTCNNKTKHSQICEDGEPAATLTRFLSQRTLYYDGSQKYMQFLLRQISTFVQNDSVNWLHVQKPTQDH